MLLIWKKWTLYGWKTRECKFVLLARLIKDDKGLSWGANEKEKGEKWMGSELEEVKEVMNKWTNKRTNDQRNKQTKGYK